jgi:hypothetical protein
MLNRKLFTCDFWSGLLSSLHSKHRNLRSKYRLTIPAGIELGMQDEEVKRRLSEESALGWSLFCKDFVVGVVWAIPAAINGIYCCCYDLTYFKEKIITGEAYRVGIWGPFFKPPDDLYFSNQVVPEFAADGQIGRDDELIIIMSCPGDHHDWYGDVGRKKIHSTFKEYAGNSKDRVSFCPVQMGIRKKDADSQEFEKPEEPYTLGADRNLHDRYRDYYCATFDAEIKIPNKDEGLDLWKAYWVSKVKLALAEAKLDYRRPITKVTFVAIHGGGEGAGYERLKLSELGQLIDNRGRIEGIAEILVTDIACCLSCGLQPKGYCQGWNSAMFYWQAAFKRAMFCTPIKGLKMKFVKTAPSNLEAYIKRQSSILVEFQDSPKDSPKASGRAEKESMIKAPVEQVWEEERLVL